MKKLPIIVIPVIVVLLLLGGVFVWKMMSPAAPAAPTQQAGTLPNSWDRATGTKPANPFSFLSSPQVTPIPSPTPATSAALNSDVASVGDDGGVTDFSSLQKEASEL